MTTTKITIIKEKTSEGPNGERIIRETKETLIKETPDQERRLPPKKP